jgi:hypothetical protein
MERLNVGGRYQPEAGKVLNAGYRYTRDQLGFEQIDISGQWPLAGGWHAVGRINYSTKDRRMVEIRRRPRIRRRLLGRARGVAAPGDAERDSNTALSSSWN